ncbi:MAG: class I SAM-dependent methyltransferase [Verrucomicrobiales bacterium]
MKNDTQYWDNYYRQDFINEASPFAGFCQENFLKQPLKIVEFGSGSGRDLRFLHHSGNQVTGYDTSTEAVAYIKSAYPDLNIVLGDFTRLDLHERLDAVYSRWTLHSIDEESADRALSWCAENIVEGGILMIEVRTINDHLYGEGKPAGRNAYITDHYRRFVVPDGLKGQLEELGFEICFFEEGQGFSVYKDDDPVLLRVMAKR